MKPEVQTFLQKSSQSFWFRTSTTIFPRLKVLEYDLRNYLVRNLSVIVSGLTLYKADGVDGEEFFVPGTARRIDILAVDKQNNYVIIELKVSRGYEKVVGQTLFYQSSIKTIFKQEKVRAIIIAREITAELKTATPFSRITRSSVQ